MLTSFCPGHQVKHDWSDMHGRPTYSEEVAGVIGMLCLPESGWCTGCSVGVSLLVAKSSPTCSLTDP